MKAYFDIDTQIDFVDPAGALYGKGSERVIPAVGELNRYAGDHGIPLISSMCAHTPDSEEFKVWPPHCIKGTPGQKKVPETILADPAKQIIIEKDDLDLFTNPSVLPLLATLRIDECFVYGIFTEYCIKCAIMGLLKSGRKVSLVMRAAASISEPAGENVIREFIAAGGHCV